MVGTDNVGAAGVLTRKGGADAVSYVVLRTGGQIWGRTVRWKWVGTIDHRVVLVSITCTTQQPLPNSAVSAIYFGLRI